MTEMSCHRKDQGEMFNCVTVVTLLDVSPVGHTRTDTEGKVSINDDPPGWMPVLSINHTFLAVLI